MPKAELLETFTNPYPDREYEIAMECPEFTSLCPLGGIESDAHELEALRGGAPDFGTIYITYVPAAQCVDAFFADVGAKNVIAHFGESRRRDQPYITGACDGNLHAGA